MTKKKRLRQRCKQLEKALAKERETNAALHRTVKEAVETVELAAKKHKRHRRLVAKLYKKLASANRKLEVANEYIELLTEHVRHANQWLAESTTAAEKRSFQNVLGVKAMERAIAQQGLVLDLDETTRKLADQSEESNGKVKAFRRG